MKTVRNFQNLAVSDAPTEHLTSSQLYRVGTNLLNRCVSNVPIGSLYKGSCGVAYILCSLASQKSHRSSAELARQARSIANNALQTMSFRRITLLEGRPGALFICIVSCLLLGEMEECRSIIAQLLDIGETSVLNLPPNECEVLYGRCGYIQAILATRRAVDALSTSPDPHIGNALLSAIVRQVFEEGTRHREFSAASPLLVWKWHDKVYLGACHGIAGILYTLLLCVEELQEVSNGVGLRYVQYTIDDLLTRHCHHTGNLRSSAGSSKDELVQWCHGASGLVHLLLLAARIYSEQTHAYLHRAETTCEIIWERGLLVKESGLCHGAAGNAYAMLALAKEMMRYHRRVDHDLWMHRVHYFARFIVARYDSAVTGNIGYDFSSVKTEINYSLFDGRAGAAALLLGLAEETDSTAPLSALSLQRFPLYDL